jgi:hypothetical protein
LLLFSFISPSLYSQDSSVFKHKNIGFGADISDDRRYYLPIYISDNFKIEPDFIIQFFKDERSYRSSSIELSIGLFYTINYQNLIPYFGLRSGFSYRDIDNPGNDSYIEKGIMFGPSIGGEYFLMERFSIGPEIYLKYKYLRRNDRDKGIQSFNTYTQFIFRVYLY